MDFDLDLAKEQSMKNPVYYTQYAAVRAQSIINKSKARKSKNKANLFLPCNSYGNDYDYYNKDYV